MNLNAKRRQRHASDVVWRTRWNAKRNKRQFLNRAYMDSLKAGGCVDCGNKNLTVLEFDHLRDKTRNIGDMRGVCWAVIDAEVAKCEVVCANCHSIRTAARRKVGVA